MYKFVQSFSRTSPTQSCFIVNLQYVAVWEVELLCLIDLILFQLRNSFLCRCKWNDIFPLIGDECQRVWNDLQMRPVSNRWCLKGLMVFTSSQTQTSQCVRSSIFFFSFSLCASCSTTDAPVWLTLCCTNPRTPAPLDTPTAIITLKTQQTRLVLFLQVKGIVHKETVIIYSCLC